MTGGYSLNEPDSDSETTTEIVDKNGAFPGPKLPWRFVNHCVAKISEFHALMIGGSYNPRSTLFLKILYEGWFDVSQQGPDLDGDGRSNHACAHIRHDNGTSYIIAAGGLINNSDSAILDTSEILEMTVPFKWRPGE